MFTNATLHSNDFIRIPRDKLWVQSVIQTVKGGHDARSEQELWLRYQDLSVTSLQSWPRLLTGIA